MCVCMRVHLSVHACSLSVSVCACSWSCMNVEVTEQPWVSIRNSISTSCLCVRVLGLRSHCVPSFLHKFWAFKLMSSCYTAVFPPLCHVPVHVQGTLSEPAYAYVSLLCWWHFGLPQMDDPTHQVGITVLTDVGLGFQVCTTTPVYPNTCVPPHLYTPTPVQPHTCVPSHLHTPHLCTSTSVCHHTCAPLHLYTITPGSN